MNISNGGKQRVKSSYQLKEFQNQYLPDITADIVPNSQFTSDDFEEVRNNFEALI